MLALDSNILREVGALSRCIHSISDMEFKTVHLQKSQFIFLTRVCEQPGINQIELSTLLKVDKTTTTKALQKLINAGYVLKKRSETDQRMWRLYPTQKSAELYPTIIAAENRNINICLQNFTAQEKTLVAQLLTRMRQNSEDSWKKLKS